MSQDITPKGRKILCGFIELNPGITTTHYVASFGINFFLGVIQLAVEALFNMLLTSKEYFNIDKREVGTISASILAGDMLMRMVTAGLFGALYDKLGRVKLVILGFLLSAISVMLMPFTAPNVFPLLLICRIFYGQGCSMAGMAPLIADYIADDYKGKATGLLLFTMTVSGGISHGVIGSVSKTVSLSAVYTFIGFFVIAGGVTTAMFLKPGLYFLENTKQNAKQPIDLKQGFLLAKKNVILMGYLIAMIQTAQTFIYASALVLWTKQFYPADAEEEANQRTLSFSGTGMGTASIVAAIFGYLTDKISSQYPFSIASIVLSVVGMSGICYIGDAHDDRNFIFFIIWALGLGPQIITAIYLIDRNAPAEARGAAHGAQGIFQLVGMIFALIVGGYLFTKVSIFSHFYLAIGLAVICLGIICYLYMTDKEESKELELDDHKLGLGVPIK